MSVSAGGNGLRSEFSNREVTACKFRMIVTTTTYEKAVDVAKSNARLAFKNAVRVEVDSVEASPNERPYSSNNSSLYDFALVILVTL